MIMEEKNKVLMDKILEYKLMYPQTQKIKIKIQKLQQQLNENTLNKNESGD